jgi:hypothetical protein
MDGTIVATWLGKHPTAGDVHCTAYQNRPVNLDENGPNGMLLHYPTAEPLTAANLLDFGESQYGLDAMVEAVGTLNPYYMPSYSTMPSDEEPILVDHGIYSLILASRPLQILDMLGEVRPNRRPDLRNARAFFESYERTSKKTRGYKFIYACFDSKEAKTAAPIGVWYVPSYPEFLLAQGLDAHDGGPPKLTAMVDCDHWVIFGGNDLPEKGSANPYYPRDIPAATRAMLPKRVVGRRYEGKHINGDFVVPVEKVLKPQNDDRGHLVGIERRILV